MNPSRSMVDICTAHSRIIPGDVFQRLATLPLAAAAD
jgi:hypothetical protein